jgi:phosphatidylinositol alpha-1,6-mannosyltransferase
MKILIVTWNFPPRRGGIEYVVSSLSAGLAKKHSVFIVTSHSAPSYSQGPVIYRPRWPGLSVFFLYALVRSGLLLCRNRSISVVLGGSALVAPIVLFLARLFNRKAVVLTHGLDLTYPSMLYKVACLRWVRFCDRIIANSRYTAELAHRRGAAEGAVTVIPPGVSCERFISLPPRERFAQALGLADRKIVLFVGRLARRKGVNEFIEQALPLIAQAVPAVCFVLVGSNPTESLAHREDLVGQLKTTVAAAALEQHVRFLGPLDDQELSKVYQIADLLVLPVLSLKDDVEGFGVVVLEAAAAGIPAVATRVGGISDAIEDRRSGILVEPGNYEQLAQSVIELLTDEEKRQRLGNYAKSRARKKFSWDKIIPVYESVLSDLVPRSD